MSEHTAESDAPITCRVCNVTSGGSTYLAFIQKHEHADLDAIAEVLERHTYVVDGPPAACGFRCACGAREATTSPESADLAARLHVAGQIATRVTPPAETDAAS